MTLGFQIFAFVREQFAIALDSSKIDIHLPRYGCVNCDDGHVYVDWKKSLPLHVMCDVCEQMYYMEEAP